MLKLQKRHLKSCRFSEFDAENVRCKCAYRIIGTINGKSVRLSAKTSNRDVAEDLLHAAEQRIAKGEQPQAPSPPEMPPLSEVVATFMRDLEGRNWEESTRRKYKTLLQDRLLAFAAQKGITRLDQIAVAQMSDFRASWKDAPRTAQKNLERMRAFFRWAIERKYGAENPATAASLRIKVNTEEKEPFTRDEMSNILETTHLVPTGHGFTLQGKHSLQVIDRENARELRAFVLLLRHTGLRISDATKLERTALVNNSQGDGWSLRVFQKKAKRWVYIPLPDGRFGTDDVLGALNTLPIKSDRYYFWTGRGGLDTATTNWRGRLDRLFRYTEEHYGAFTHRAHPHRFRHTFAAEHLLAGMDIKLLSILLGHKSVQVTEQHYAKFNAARMAQAEEAVKQSWLRQAARTMGKNAAKISPIQQRVG